MSQLKSPVDSMVNDRVRTGLDYSRPSAGMAANTAASGHQTLIDALLAEQRSLTAVERFSKWHESRQGGTGTRSYRRLIPLAVPKPGEQYAFEVDLDKCSGCKACVTACHALNGLEEAETWRSVGLLVSSAPNIQCSSLAPHASRVQHVTTACHHCADPGCANGCPVLAYEKDQATGIVRHLDDQCMGCSYCVMKCPYEVPKYSSRLGIVRKCDMCHQRLTVGEAPACVQACPDEAIRITVVRTDKVRGRYRGLPTQMKKGNESSRGGRAGKLKQAHADAIPLLNLFLPDAPDPAITLPTTRYLTGQARFDVIAADHDAVRLEPAHWPLIVMLVLTQAASGTYLAAAGAQLMGRATLVQPLALAGCAMLLAGLTAAVLHLGQPLKAWRSFLGWRTSWLSREIIAFNVFAAAALLACRFPAFSVFTAACGLVAVFTSAMVYVDTRRPLWSAHFVLINFFGTALLLGATLAAVVSGLSATSLVSTQTAAFAALVIRTALLVWRRLHWRAALRNPANPIHYNARIVDSLLPWTMRARTQLYVVSTGFGLLALGEVAKATPLWVTLVAVTTFGSEILVRYVFFSASASKRMPGGIVA